MLALFCKASRSITASGQTQGLAISIIPLESRGISTTCALYAEPPRKKRRIDPAVFKLRIERKIRKTEKEVNRLESEPRQFAPVLEYQLTNSDIKDLTTRPKHSYEDFGVTPSAILGARRLWSFYRQEQSRMDRKSISRLQKVQAIALKRLKNLDSELYDRTVALDETNLIPYRSSHVRRETPPNPDYSPPDGHITDITKKWVM